MCMYESAFNFQGAMFSHRIYSNNCFCFLVLTCVITL